MLKSLGILSWHLAVYHNKLITYCNFADINLTFLGTSISGRKIQFHKEVQPLILFEISKKVKKKKCRTLSYPCLKNDKMQLVANSVLLSGVFSHVL